MPLVLRGGSMVRRWEHSVMGRRGHSMMGRCVIANFLCHSWNVEERKDKGTRVPTPSSMDCRWTVLDVLTSSYHTPSQKGFTTFQ